jgi:hypothetical protein
LSVYDGILLKKLIDQLSDSKIKGIKVRIPHECSLNFANKLTHFMNKIVVDRATDKPIIRTFQNFTEYAF